LIKFAIASLNFSAAISGFGRFPTLCLYAFSSALVAASSSGFS